ncbi:MAG: hypothetical protein ACOX6Z_03325, partial [Dethiobacteria bacterium]
VPDKVDRSHLLHRKVKTVFVYKGKSYFRGLAKMAAAFFNMATVSSKSATLLFAAFSLVSSSAI